MGVRIKDTISGGGGVLGSTLLCPSALAGFSVNGCIFLSLSFYHRISEQQRPDSLDGFDGIEQGFLNIFHLHSLNYVLRFILIS